MRRLIAALASAGVLASLALTATTAQAATTGPPKLTLTRNTILAVCEGGLVENPIQLTVAYKDGSGTPITSFAVFTDNADTTIRLPAAVDSNTMASLRHPVEGIPGKFWVEALNGGRFLSSTQVVSCVKPKKHTPPPPHCFWIPTPFGPFWVCLSGRKS